MAFLNSMFAKVFAGRKSPRRNRRGLSQKRNRRLGMEQVEARMMMSAGMSGTVPADDLTPPLFAAPDTGCPRTSSARTGSALASPAAASIRVGSSRLMAPAAPSLTATAVSASQIDLSWHSVSGASGYLVDEWVNGAWKQIGSLGSGSTGCAVTGLSAGTTYYFDVAAYNAAGTSWANVPERHDQGRGGDHRERTGGGDRLQPRQRLALRRQRAVLPGRAAGRHGRLLAAVEPGRGGGP